MSGFELNNDDVLSTGTLEPMRAFDLSPTFQFFELLAVIKRAFSHIGHGNSDELFTDAGIKCKALRSRSGGWQSGKLRFRIEFIPDEPENISEILDEPKSPLDDLRSNLDI